MGLRVRLSGAPSATKASRQPARGLGAPATSPRGYQCYFVNIAGPDVVPNYEPAGGAAIKLSACVGYGAMSKLATESDAFGAGIPLTVHTGRQRTLKLFGVMTDDPAGCVRYGSATELIGSSFHTSIYQLAVGIVDILREGELHVPASPTPGKDIVSPPCFPDGTAPGGPFGPVVVSPKAPASPPLGTDLTFTASGGDGGPYSFIGSYLTADGIFKRPWLAGTFSFVAQDGHQNASDPVSIATHASAVQIGAGSGSAVASLFTLTPLGNFHMLGVANGGYVGSGPTQGQGKEPVYAKFDGGAHRITVAQAGDSGFPLPTVFTPAAIAVTSDEKYAYYLGLSNSTLSGGMRSIVRHPTAENGAAVWERVLQGSKIGGGAGATTSPATITSLATDAAGNVYVYLGSNAILPTSPAAGNDVGGTAAYVNSTSQTLVAAKYDQYGTLSWLTELGAGDGLIATAQAAGFANNTLYLTGNVNGSFPGFLPPVRERRRPRARARASFKKVFLFVVDKDTGIPSYTRQFGSGNGHAFVTHLRIGPVSGDVYLAGHTASSLSGATPIGQGSGGNQNVWVGRFDKTDGHKIWLNEIQSAGTDSSTIAPYGGLSLDASETRAVVAATTTGNVFASRTGTQDLFVAGFDATSGAQLSGTHQMGNSGTTIDVGSLLVVESSAYVYGNSSGNQIPGNHIGGHGNYDVFLHTTVFGPAPTYGMVTVGATTAATTDVRDATNGINQNVRVDAGGNIYVSGTTTAALLDSTATFIGSHGTSDAFVAQITPAGALGWMRQIGGGATATFNPEALEIDTGALYLHGTVMGGTLPAYVQQGVDPSSTFPQMALLKVNLADGVQQ